MEYLNYNDYMNNIGYTHCPYMNNECMPNINANYYMKHNNYNNMECINPQYENNTYMPYRDSTMAAVKSQPNENLKEALALIKKSVESEKEDEMFYETLLSQTNNKQDREIIQSIIADERKHNRMFREIYRELTGIILPKSEMKVAEVTSTSYLNNLEKALFGELAAVEKYRKIMAAMPDKQKYNMLMEIMTDELKHASKYNFLITKNMR